MDFTNLEKLEMENHRLFGWVHSEEALGDAPYMSESRFSVSLYGDALYPTTEPPDLPPSIDSLHIAPLDAVPQDQYCRYHFQYSLDDFNFDSFAWDDALLEPNGDAAADLSITPSTDRYSISSVVAYNLDDISCEERKEYCSSGMNIAGQGDESTRIVDGSQWMESKDSFVKSRSSSISFDEVSKYFCMPIMEAAKNMKVGLTVLKKRCRELGISRWPHRKMKSLNSLIHNVQELGKGVATEDCVRKEVETLEEHKRLMEMMPEMQLSERTKKLRQACFKANFKKRRALQYPPLSTHPSVLL
ncbi:hypothetical protein Taro_016293 [Colocasia esculenta]|uniref:RWP-RK domain-containing protein n=1 Tax=Colocasia esculenta TaxID=4460 RepID=A0A843USI2_COLES|nr:hypothetical protein [Colocasia esculenta]